VESVPVKETVVEVPVKEEMPEELKQGFEVVEEKPAIVLEVV
jgi:hypothetical protein